jgi:hypothetical protein
MGIAPCIKDDFLPQSSAPDQREIREREQAAEIFFRSLLGERCWQAAEPNQAASTHGGGIGSGTCEPL